MPVKIRPASEPLIDLINNLFRCTMVSGTLEG
jgi:hypothetical protein